MVNGRLRKRATGAPAVSAARRRAKLLLGKDRGRDCLAEIVALSLVATVFAQEFGILDQLDPFGNDPIPS
jgi:hypothetical protein